MEKILKKAAIILFASACIYQIVQQWRSTVNLDSGAEALAAWESRFESVNEVIPIERGVIGYLGEWDVPGVEYGSADQRAEYLLTQYALAPLILVRGANAEWNVAVLSASAFQAWEQNNRGKYQVYPLQNNVYVLQKTGDE